ncbi:MAG: site-specific integrase [Candidatus Acidiferrales bacterium]
MPSIPRVRLLKQIKIDGKWARVPALYDNKGRIRRDHVRVNGTDEVHPEGSYCIEFWDHGKRRRDSAGPDAFAAAEKARIKDAEISAIRHGIIPPPAAPAPEPERTTVADAVKSYTEYIQYHRSLRTFRTYRPMLATFRDFCSRTYIDEVTREDLLAFGTACLKQGQKGKSIYNKLVVVSQFLKHYGRPKLLQSADWPSFVATVRPI